MTMATRSPPPDRISGNLALDLANTINWRGGGTRSLAFR